MPFFQKHFHGINVVNIGGRDIVFYSKDEESYIDFKTDKVFRQNVNSTQDIWHFLGCFKCIASSLLKVALF